MGEQTMICVLSVPKVRKIDSKLGSGANDDHIESGSKISPNNRPFLKITQSIISQELKGHCSYEYAVIQFMSKT